MSIFKFETIQLMVNIVKSEYYLLWGKREVDEKIIDKLSTISDLFSIAYLAVLIWSIYNGLSGIKKDPDVKRNFLISATLVVLIAFINFLKLLVSLLKQFCCNFDPPPYSSSA
ncbi:20724_t:CDS:1 [Racocetra persica]|uniref:20724_t:CDS:1 n=1 Tax=Racocetra persica TaxID=160502 RepID=A0ACA9PEK1_9GLOM|nr:20724_t:CDS:1 [Racocetra persica]